MCPEIPTTRSHRPMAVLYLVAFVVLVLLLSGCSGGAVTEEIWLNSGERWKVDLTLSLTSSERSMLDGAFDQEDDWDKLVEDAEAEGVSIDWRQREDPGGGVTYIVSAEGQGLDKLNGASFDGEASLTKDDSGHIHLTWIPTSMAMLRSYALTIHGGEIISSNANEETESSATWYNPSRVQVELTEGGVSVDAILAVGMACACLLGLVIIGGVVVFVLLQRQRSESAPVV